MTDNQMLIEQYNGPLATVLCCVTIAIVLYNVVPMMIRSWREGNALKADIKELADSL